MPFFYFRSSIPLQNNDRNYSFICFKSFMLPKIMTAIAFLTILSQLWRPEALITLVCCLIDFQLNNAECFFIDKATERGDAVASLSEVNAVRWENRQVI